MPFSWCRRDVTTLFKSLLLQFIGDGDPLLSMLQWMTQALRRARTSPLAAIPGAGEHALFPYRDPNCFTEETPVDTLG